MSPSDHPVRDSNDPPPKAAQPWFLDPEEREKYWKLVKRTVSDVFHGSEEDVETVKHKVERDPNTGEQRDPTEQEGFYQTEAFTVAADIAGQPGPGSPAQRRAYLNIRRQIGLISKLADGDLPDDFSRPFRLAR
jgi:hypothetical protein